MPDELRATIDKILDAAKRLDSLVPRIDEPDQRTVRVSPGDDVNQALLSLHDAGGRLLAKPGHYDVKLKALARPEGAPPIVIETDPNGDLPKPGEQVTREHIPALAVFATSQSGQTFTAENQARNMSLVNVAFGPTGKVADTQVALGGDKRHTTRVEDLPENFSFDRVLFFGEHARGQHRGLLAHARMLTIENCGFYDLVEPGRDSQAICAWNGGIGVLVENCTLEAGAENLLLGGSDAASEAMLPRDWIVRRCRIRKDPAWKTWANYSSLNIKALVEMKAGVNVAFDGLTLEHAWKKNWDAGAAIILKCANQENTAPFTVTRNVRISNVQMRGVDRPLQFVGYGDGGNVTQRMSDISVRNVLTLDANAQAVRLANPPDNLTIDHVTLLHGGNVFLDFWFGQGQGPGSLFAWTNSIMTEGAYGIKGQYSGGGIGYKALEQIATGARLEGNVIAGTSSRAYPGNVKLRPEAVAAALDVSGRARDTFGIKTTDGKVPGADIDAILAAGAPAFL